MKKALLISLCAAAPILTIAALQMQFKAPVTGDYIVPFDKTPSKHAPVPETGDRQKTISSDNFFYEDFETVNESTGLPEGWITIATPANPDDKWAAGRLNVNAVSGYNCAYVLGGQFTENHDTWLFSPSVHIDADNLKLEYFLYLPSIGDGSQMPDVSVVLCDAQSPDAVVKELNHINENIEYWIQFTDELGSDIEPGDYYIGFHCTSPAIANTMCLDDVKVADENIPDFKYDPSIDFGPIDHAMATSYILMLSNAGNGELQVWLKDCSPELSCDDLQEPFTIQPWYYGQVMLRLKGIPEGPYEGFITLGTNDPVKPEVTIPVYADGIVYPTSDVIIEGFEDGKPEHWDYSRLTFVLKAYGAHTGNMAWYSNSSYCHPTTDFPGMGFITNYVNLGDNPEVSFWFKAYTDNGPASNEYLTATVRLSNEDGEWDEVWSITPGEEGNPEITGDFQQVQIPLGAEHAGKTCRVCVAFHTIGSSYDLLIDDLFIGTVPENDAALQVLQGPTLLNLGQTATYTVDVKNNSASSIQGAGITIKDELSDTEIKVIDCPELPGQAVTPVSFEWSPSEAGTYRLVAEYSNMGDSDETNNISSPVNVSVLNDENRGALMNDGKECKSGLSMPVDFNSLEYINQTIYPANEIGINKGTINSLAYPTILNEPYMSDNFKIYIAETDKDNFADGEMIPDSEFVKVFDSRVYFPAGNGTLVIPFEQPYEYKGGNLVVMTTRQADNFMYGIFYKIWFTHNAEIRSLQSSSLYAGNVFGNDNRKVYLIEAYPETTINMIDALAGSVEGTVTDANGPVKDALVTIKGSKLSTRTDANGHYSLPRVAVGDVAIEVEAHGYRPLTSESNALAQQQTLTINAQLEAYPKFAVTGKISDDNGVGLADVLLTLDGYDDYTATTDADGNYSFANVTGQTGVEYNVKATHPYFREYRGSVEVNDMLARNLTLAVKPGKPSQVTPAINADNSECTLTWDEPLVEYSYDSGVPVDFGGWTTGTSQIGMGARFLKHSNIREVSFYVGSFPTGHERFNVIIFGLLPDGTPNKNNILFMAENIDFVEDGWTTYRLPYPVEADGFLVFITCDGFLKMGYCDPTEEYPFEPGQYYYAGDGYSVQFSAVETWREAHFMIRAHGVDLGEWSGSGIERNAVKNDFNGKPNPQYNIYRVENNEYVKLAKVDGTSWTDKDYYTLPEGKYNYAVTADYDGTESIASVTRTIDKQTAGIVEVGPTKLTVSLSNNELLLSDPALVEHITISYPSGMVAASLQHPAARISLDNLNDGILILTVKGTDGKVSSFKIKR